MIKLNFIKSEMNIATVSVVFENCQKERQKREFILVNFMK